MRNRKASVIRILHYPSRMALPSVCPLAAFPVSWSHRPRLAAPLAFLFALAACDTPPVRWVDAEAVATSLPSPLAYPPYVATDSTLNAASPQADFLLTQDRWREAGGQSLLEPTIAAMAEASLTQGAIGVRRESPEHIGAVRRRCPGALIVGLWKRTFADSPVYITPGWEEIRAVWAAGASSGLPSRSAAASRPASRPVAALST